MPSLPTIDGTVVVGEPGDQFLAGKVPPLPILIGSTAVDVPLHFPPSRLRPLKWLGDGEGEARQAYGVADLQGLAPKRRLRLLLSIGAHLTMHEPAHFVAAVMRRAGQPAWVYRSTYTAETTRPGKLAQSHAGELPFLFDTLGARYGDAITDADQAMATAFNAYVASVVATGDPNGEGRPRWPQARADAFDVLDFSLEAGPVFGPDPRATVELVGPARPASRPSDGSSRRVN